MVILGELFASQRKAKRISLKRAARDLAIKKEKLEALEQGQWQELPEAAFTRGFIKNYADYLGLDSKHALALFRREYDEAKYPPKSSVPRARRGLMLTPTRIFNLIFILAIFISVAYLLIQYLSILSAPKLKVSTPPDDFTASVPVIVISGQTEKGSQLSIDGQLVSIDPEGNFSYQLELEEGKNVIEIIASKRLSPKTKVVKIVRLTK